MNKLRRKKVQRKLIEELAKKANLFSDIEFGANRVTKNILPFAKKPHFKLIEAKLGKNFIKDNLKLNEIKNSPGINLDGYHYMYNFAEIR